MYVKCLLSVCVKGWGCSQNQQPAESKIGKAGPGELPREFNRERGRASGCRQRGNRARSEEAREEGQTARREDGKGLGLPGSEQGGQEDREVRLRGSGCSTPGESTLNPRTGDCFSQQAYSRQALLNIGRSLSQGQSRVPEEVLKQLGIWRSPAASPAPPTVTARVRRFRKRCERARKRGKRGGIQVRLKASPNRPALPSILLANVRSLDNKLDHLRLQRSTRRDMRDCCVFAFTETWLNDNIPDTAVQLDGHSLYRADRIASLSGKTRGGGLCVYISKAWCQDTVVVTKHCSALVEFLLLKCRPYYLPREFTSIIMCAVYIPPSANTREALNELHEAISAQQTAHPEACFIVVGDFNQANLKTVLPKFYQHINFATREKNALDKAYTSLKGAYKAFPLPHLGSSDHISILLRPAYRPQVKLDKPVRRSIRVWSDGSTSALQDCLETTNWNIFKEAATHNHHTDLQEYSESVLGYIQKCTEDVTELRSITVRANQKPWMTGEVRSLLRTRDAAFKAKDKTALSTARKNLSRGIKGAKHQYSQRISSDFNDSKNARRLWQGIQTITDYKAPPQTCDGDPSLPDQLNTFYARFEATNNTPALKALPQPGEQALCLTPLSVRRALSRTNPRKAAGPDNIPGRVLRDCAEQLENVLTDIFNISLQQAVVPKCLKSATIIPVPKRSPALCMNDYRPIALTPILMKCFERLVMWHIKSILPPNMDPHQYAYRANRSTDDAVSSALHSALTHLEKKDTYVRMLFIDFSSAFNTIIPQQLIEKLSALGLGTPLCNWILDFLIDRPQSVKMGGKTSRTITLSTGSPQGCVLSPLLFTLLTHDCVARSNSNHIVKFADDTTVVGLVTNNDETHYRGEVNQLTEWCSKNNLSLNVEKTKEMIVDFRKGLHVYAPLTINGTAVEQVTSTKFLGVHIANDLNWSMNTKAITRKAQQRLYFLRRLRKANCSPFIMKTFYRGAIESILTHCITIWHGNCTAAGRNSLQRLVRAAEKIAGVSLPSVADLYAQRCVSKAKNIMSDPSHHLFVLLPSGRRLQSIQARSTRLSNSFFPQAIRTMNSLRTLPPPPTSAPSVKEAVCTGKHQHFTRPMAAA